MSGSGRRRSSKWDLEEDISPENHRDSSRDHMSGTGDLQRAEGMKEESVPGFDGDGNYATRKSTGPDGGRHQSRTHSSRSGGRSYRNRSRSRSKSRSRSPVRNPRRQPSLNDRNSRSGHSAPLCRDFSAGRCRKGDRCLFAHHCSLERHLDKRVGSDQESMHKDDKSLRSHSDTYSTGRRSTNICNDFLKGRCRRGASCKFPHHDSGSDEFRKGTVDGSYQDGHSYDHNEHVYTEKKSPDDWQPKHNLNSMHEVPSDTKWNNRTSPRSMPKTPDWDEDIVQEASTEICYASGLMQADAPGDYKQQNLSATGMANNVSSFANHSVSSDIPTGQGIHQLNESFGASPITCVNGVQQSQPTFPSNPMDRGIQMPYLQAIFPLNPMDTHMANADVSQAASGPNPNQSSALSEQLSQIPHLSTTLSNLFEKKEQLPQLYADIPQGAVMQGRSHISNSSAYVPPVLEATSLLNQATEFSQQYYDPICDSIETKLVGTGNELMSSSVEQRRSVLGTTVIPSSSDVPTSLVTGEMTSDFLVGLSGDELGHQSADPNHQGPVSKEEENEGAAGNGTNEAQDKGAEEEDMAVNGDINDDKKAKDVKEMRPFKFALAEFVKELLKPTWKEGKMSKEVYKTIVKKVVDKVADSIQEAHIPRTKEKIDQYLSFSKPKLTKLVQAYLERYKKS